MDLFGVATSANIVKRDLNTFLNPEFRGKGIGRKLKKIMLDWYFANGKENVWLGTSRNTRAEKFHI